MRLHSVQTIVGVALAGILGAVACSGSGGGGGTGMPGGASGAGSGGAGAAGVGSSPAGSGGTGGAASGQGGSAGGAAGASGGGIGGSMGSAAGTGGAAGAGGATGAAGAGVAGNGGGNGGSSGAAGAPAHPTGNSVGCGVAPPTNDRTTGFTIHSLAVPACAGGAVTPKCVVPAFAPGGALAQTNGAYDFTKRNYAVQLPTGYDDSKPYALIIGGGGCGGGPTESGGGFSAGQGPADAIRIGLSYVNMCFADGGNSCSGTPANQPACVNNPEVPYFYAMLADVEAKYCIDKAKVYMGGYSSGGWETFTMGCAAADVLRGIVTENGGLRHHRPACTGAIPALMVAGTADTDNPIGPLVMDMAYAPSNMTVADVNAAIISLDSNGTAPARDDILARNGCVGTDTAEYDPAYPLCKKYTGCPASAPVVWCPITAAGHAPLAYGGITYAPGSVAGDSLLWKFLTTLP